MRCRIICHHIAFADASDCDREDFFWDLSLFRQKRAAFDFVPAIRVFSASYRRVRNSSLLRLILGRLLVAQDRCERAAANCFLVP